ncbi:hypothetical protein HOD96_03255 [Candidatus Falkowbacteria bacterium]|jgi:phosphoribosylformylglycinamidine cyclo-ligase|nr:hypothetical protein [Candidatus Falkowbacteria bacterium]
MTDKYKEDGVDIDVGDAFSKLAGLIARSTYDISPFVKVHDLSKGMFRGPRGFTWQNLPKGCINTGTVDGIGTKVVIIVASGKAETSANDVIAMTAMDITRWGGLPLVFLNVFDVRTLGEIGSETYQLCQNVMAGLGTVAKEHGYVVLTGETAELGKCVGSEDEQAKLMFNWAGTMLGVYHPNKMILGDTLAPEQSIIVFADYFRSNGISSVRRGLANHRGRMWWQNSQAKEDIIACATPSKQYDRMFNEAHGWLNEPEFDSLVKMHLIVHLSGGAFESKLGEDILKPLCLSAELSDLFDPPDIMKKCANWREMEPQECYKTWNGGQGALAVVDKKDEGIMLALAEKYGIRARVAGQITERKEHTVTIKSKFGNGEMIYY